MMSMANGDDDLPIINLPPGFQRPALKHRNPAPTDRLSPYEILGTSCRSMSRLSSADGEPKARASVTDHLVDIRYVCAACGMETHRIRLPQSSASHVLGSTQGLLPLLIRQRAAVVRVDGNARQVSEPPVVQCPGCHQPMESQ